MREYPADQEAFVNAYRRAYPEAKPGASRNWGHEAYNLVHEVKVSHLIIYPPKPRLDSDLYLGQVLTEYTYDENAEFQFCHLLGVTWLKKFSRNQVSPGAQKQLNIPLTLYKVNDCYTGEFAAMIGRAVIAPTSDDRLYTATLDSPVRDEDRTRIETETGAETKTHIITVLARDLTAREMEEFVAHLLELAGYSATVTPLGPDRGIDIVAVRKGFAAEEVLKVQVKSTQGSVGDPKVSAFYGKVRPHEFGLFVTLGTFTPQARSEADHNPNLKLADGTALAETVLKYYPRLDARYKKLLRL